MADYTLTREGRCVGHECAVLPVVHHHTARQSSTGHVSAVPGIGQSVHVFGSDDGVIREAVSGKESLCLVVCKGQ